MKTFWTLFPILLVLLVNRTLPLSANPEAPRPNLIFVLTDDLGPGDIGVLWQNDRPATRRHHTPHLDQMAAQGQIMARHYTSAPVCAPARASLLTGRHQGHATVRDNQFDKALEDNHTLGTVLQEAGYSTAIIGKWGLQGEAGLPGHPLNRGFDYFFGYLSHEAGHFHYPYETNQPFFENHTDISGDLEGSYSTDLINARAKQWIIDQVNDDPTQPFFLYLSHVAPHAGLRIPTDSHLTAETNYPPGGGLTGGVQWLGTPGNMLNTSNGTWDTGFHPDYVNAEHNGQPWPDYARRYATMVRRLDDGIGDLFQLLEDLDIADNTLIVFTSDNGTQNAPGLDNVGVHDPRFFQTFGPYDGIKRDLWEGGIRMPTLIRWPAAIPAGGVIDSPSQFHDWLPTFTELAGLPGPAVSDGVSLVPVLTGQGEAEEGIVYVEYFEWNRTPNWSEFESAHRNQLRRQMQAVFLGNYKGVRYDITNPLASFRVYDVVNDSKETTNLAGQPGIPTDEDFLHASLRQRRIDGEAPRPYDSLLIPGVGSFPTAAGLERSGFSGPYPWVPDARRIVPENGDLVSDLSLEGETSFSDGYLWQGYLDVPVAGEYFFGLQTNGRAIIRIHQALLVDADFGYTPGTTRKSGMIRLAAGLHPVTIHFLTGADSPEIELTWEGPTGGPEAIPESAWRVPSDEPPPPPPPLPTPSLWLPLNDGAGDDVRNVNEEIVGFLVGYDETDERWGSGPQGGGLHFNGEGNRVEFNAQAGLPPLGGSPRTFTAWLRLPEEQPQLGVWLSYGTASAGRRMSLRIDEEDSSRLLRAEIQGAAAIGTTPLPADEWFHVAYVFDDLNGDGTLNLNEARFYLNGQNEPLTLTSGGAAIDTGEDFPITLGDSLHASDYAFAGMLEEVRIYPVALSAGEIAALAQRRAAPDRWYFQNFGIPSPGAEDWLDVVPGLNTVALLRYALGQDLKADPNKATPALQPTNGETFSFGYLRRSDGLPDDLFQIERSPDLSPLSWTPVVATETVTPCPENSALEWVEVPLPTNQGMSREFYRLRVFAPED